jgi:flagellar biosynthesis regulator FlaF
LDFESTLIILNAHIINVGVWIGRECEQCGSQNNVVFQGWGALPFANMVEVALFWLQWIGF